MASRLDWARAYATQARADFETFEILRPQEVPECHKLQFLQMACEKLVKAYLCDGGADPAVVQTSHAYIAGTLPVLLQRQAYSVNFTGPEAREVLRRARHFSHEVELLAPSVMRAGQRPDNCEYPWEDAAGGLHLPLDWSFFPTQFLTERPGRAILMLIAGAIRRLAP